MSRLLLSWLVRTMNDNSMRKESQRAHFEVRSAGSPTAPRSVKRNVAEPTSTWGGRHSTCKNAVARAQKDWVSSFWSDARLYFITRGRLAAVLAAVLALFISASLRQDLTAPGAVKRMKVLAVWHLCGTQQ